MADAKKFQVQFQPTGRRVAVPEGASLLEAARQAGIALDSTCGGEGTCGQCQVRVPRGKVPPANENEELLLDALELAEGRRLACCIPVAEAMVVEVPRESVTSGQRLQLESTLEDIPVDSLVRRFVLDLPRPTLQDARSDFTRIADTLQSTYGVTRLTAPLESLRSLPDALRNNQWRVAVFVREDPGGENVLVGIGPSEARPVGLCVDLGTTKIAAALVDLETGQVLASQGAPNPQLGYGEDVISRINYVYRSVDGGKTLAEKVQTALNDLLGEMVAESGLSRGQVVDVVIVGNTVMMHLLLRLPVRQLASAPYVPATSDGLNIPASQVGLEMAPGAALYLPPCVGGFVGSDHVAMILATGLDRSAKVSLGIDIGTNTEIVIRKPGRPLLGSASCASGPAFEGAHIGEGMRAASGAIEKVALTREGLKWVTIQNEAPVGVCGSGIIDAIAELHRVALINRQGTFQRGSSQVREGKNGGEFVLVPATQSGTGRDIVIDQKDIGEIQLAKGAIHAGLQILLNVTETAPEAVEEVVIAGAFGSFLNILHVTQIGLLPRLPNARYRQVGNAALVGARWMLVSKQARQRAQEIQRDTQYVELTTFPTFNRIFAHSMLFPNLDDKG